MNKYTSKNGKVNSYHTLVFPIEGTMAQEIKDVKCIDHMCHNTLGDSTMVKYMIKVSLYNSGNPEDWISFVKLSNKCLAGQKITKGPQKHQLEQWVL